MNLRLSKGKVPIRGRGETPYLMVNFPNKNKFERLYGKKNIYKHHIYWEIVNKLKNGSTLSDAGKPYKLTRERVRQIEAKFIRLVGEYYWKELDHSIGLTQHFSQDTFLMLEKRGTSLPEDGSH